MVPKSILMLDRPRFDTIAGLLNESLGRKRPLRLRVTSQSMAPILVAGDWVSVEAVPGENLVPGDIVVIQRESDFVTHRLVALTAGGCHTKGDRCPTADPPVPPQAILGWVTARQRGERLYDLRRFPRVRAWIAKTGWAESRATAWHPGLRYPFRLLTRLLIWIFF